MTGHEMSCEALYGVNCILNPNRWHCKTKQIFDKHLRFLVIPADIWIPYESDERSEGVSSLILFNVSLTPLTKAAEYFLLWVFRK